jgi:predicted nuclease of predicted toxin-antitoxin system
MKLLLDANLSYRIVGQISDIYPESAHVKAFGLGTASDNEVWQFAKDHGFVLVSKDADFRHRSLLYGPPTKFIYLRVGNCPTSNIVRVLRERQAAIEEFNRHPAESLLVIS